MKALIIGATGATGNDLIKVLLQDPQYTEVVIFVRRQTGIIHPKLSEVITNFDNLEQVAALIKGDIWFSCLGTTLKTAGLKEKQWHIDYEIPVRFAEIAKRNGVPHAVLLSAYGAAASSRVFYSKMKGQLEDKIDSLAFKAYIIFRPGLLLRKDTDRAAERIMAGLLKFLNAIGIIRKFKPMPTSILAEKLAKAPKTFTTGKHVIELQKIFTF
jgi:uncharacterized protein YbjT (DUF2867 family)